MPEAAENQFRQELDESGSAYPENSGCEARRDSRF